MILYPKYLPFSIPIIYFTTMLFRILTGKNIELSMMADTRYLVLLHVLSLFYLCLSLTEEQPNVCQNPITGVLYCCFNFENNNDNCVECKAGYSSREGKPCEPCRNGKYGYRCIETCDCESDMTCDNVVGCLNESKSTIIRSLTVTKEDRTKTSNELGESTTNNFFVTRYNNNSTKRHGEEFDVPKVEANHYIIVMAIVIVTLVVYIGVVHIFCFMLYKNKKNHRNIVMPENQYDEIGTIHYDAAPFSPVMENNTDLTITDSVSSSNEEQILHLERIAQSEYSKDTESSGESSQQDDNAGYLDVIEHYDDDSEHLDVVDSDGNQDCLVVVDLSSGEILNEYVQSYTTLVPPCVNEHQYNFFPINYTEGIVTDRPSIEPYINLRI